MSQTLKLEAINSNKTDELYGRAGSSPLHRPGRDEQSNIKKHRTGLHSKKHPVRTRLNRACVLIIFFNHADAAKYEYINTGPCDTSDESSGGDREGANEHCQLSHEKERQGRTNERGSHRSKKQSEEQHHTPAIR